MHIYFIRHGMTEGNRLRQYIGRTDEPLCGEGRAQLHSRVAQGCYPKVERLCISPMLRCRQTAELLYPGMPRLEDGDLREMDFGDFEGQTYEQLKKRPDYQAWLEGGLCPGGEEREHFIRRCREAFIRCVQTELEHNTQSLAIIAHGGTIMAVLSGLDIQQGNFYDYQVGSGGGFCCQVEQDLWRTQRRIIVEGKL